MQINNPSSSRAAWYDRNPTSIDESYSATIAPATSTQRWSYTVPSAKKTNIETTYMRSVRATAPTTNGLVYCTTKFTDAASNTLDIIQTVGGGSTVDSTSYINQATTMMMQAGEVYAGLTEDDSTGGTISFGLTMKGTEFDA